MTSTDSAAQPTSGTTATAAGELTADELTADELTGSESTDSESTAGVLGAEPTATPGRGRGAGLGSLGWLRWGWRQLTSMRTALILLFLLALASVPGSVLPQQGIDPAAVSQYYQSHPALAPILNRLSLFDVFAAPWFAAIYLLLFTSLAGCVLPRTVRLVGSARQQPPRAPTNLARLPENASYVTAVSPATALERSASLLRGRRFRISEGEGWVSAEKGYLREAGNLLFHLALLALLFSVGLGGIFGYKANRLLIVGQGFADTPTALDVFRPGRLVGPGDLAPFTINLHGFTAKYVTSGPQLDQPLFYDANLSYQAQPGGPVRHYQLVVNHPLVVDGVSVYLIGHGYAPIFKVTDGTGTVRWDGPVAFIPVDQTTLTSEGVIKVPDAKPGQLGFAGVFLPSAVDEGGRLESAFPEALNPRVSLVGFTGNLGMNSGQAQSVYQLDTTGLKELPMRPRPLAAGQSIKLPDGLGTVTYLGYQQWISLAITYDPGQLPALASAIAALAGLILSFLVRRRRVFVRAAAANDGSTRVTIGGLARSDAAGGFETEFATLTGLLRAEISTGNRAGQQSEPGLAVPADSDDAAALAGTAGGPGESSPLASTAGGSAGSSPLASAAGASGGSSPLDHTADDSAGASSPTASTQGE
jgi:cytochrome c biogenesis protein